MMLILRFKLVDDLIKAERIEEAYTQLLTLSIENSDDERFQDRFDYVTNFRDEVYRQRIDTYLARFQANNKDKVAAQRLAEYYQYLQEYDSAYEILETYFNEVPEEKDKRLRFQFAKVVAWDRDFDYAIELTDELLEEDPENLDYQLFRAQLSVWNNREIELVGPYLENVLAKRPDNLEAIIAMGSYMLLEQEFDSAQVYADRAAEIDPLNNDVITLQTNIDFQKLRAEEEERYAILQEGRQYVLDGDCESALPFYEQYLDEAEPNSLILKEYGDVLFCAKQYDEALSIYEDVLNEGYFYEAALQRGKLLYTKGDSVGALIAFKELNAREPGEFEPYLYMGDSYAKLGVFDSANVVYDSLLLREDIDSTQIKMVLQRQDWIPPTGLSGILKRFPSSVGLAPSLTFYSDNLSFRYTKIGGRLDVGVTSFLALGVSFFKTYINADRNSLDSATVFLVDSLSNFQNDFTRNYTSFKGHIFLRFSDRFNIGVGSGVLNADGIQSDVETDVFATYQIPDTLNITATYLNSDAAIVLYSPYLIDLTIDDNRLFASLYKIQGKYTHKKQWQLSGSFQYVSVSDNNEGNDFMFRAGKYFENDMIAGYEYFYSNFKFVDDFSPFYYSPEGFESHSLWADFIIEKNKTADISIGGLIGYVPENDFCVLKVTLTHIINSRTIFRFRGIFQPEVLPAKIQVTVISQVDYLPTGVFSLTHFSDLS
jgi:predicted Zn-dependent protease